MLVSRIFTVLAAVLLVSAFALIVLPPDGLTLLQGLAQLAPDTPGELKAHVVHVFGSRAWVHVFVPVLVRPVWMVPLALGMVCIGAAATTLPPAELPRRTGRRL